MARKVAPILDRQQLERLAAAVWSRRGGWQDDPDAFTADPACAEILNLLRAAHPTIEQLTEIIEWARREVEGGPDLVLIGLVLDLMPTLGQDPRQRGLLIELLWFGPRGTIPPIRPHALRVLRALADGPAPLLTDLVIGMPPRWADDEYVGPAAAAIAARLLAEGDQIDESAPPEVDPAEGTPWYVTTLDHLIDRLGAAGAMLGPVAGRLALKPEFSGVLRFLTAEQLEDPEVHVTPALDALADEIAASIARTPAGSVVVAGEGGCGRSTVISLAARRLAADNWLVVEASPDELVAGQVYINQLDGRIQRLTTVCSGRRIVLVMPQFESALTVGRHQSDPRSVADRLVAPVARGAPPVIAEMAAEALDSFARESPPMARIMFVTRPPRYTDAALIEIGRAAAQRACARERVEATIDDATLEHALRLARHLLAHLALPSSLTRLVTAAVARLPKEPGVRTIGRTQIFAGLTQLTGMPRTVVDDAERLDLAEVRDWFASRVLGQQEAVDALVARIALIKAGLTDPNRPYGSLLFVGPTGTGKTEIARALAEYLFGSTDRLLRIDMSELKTPEGIARLTGTGDVLGRRSLASQVRSQPFSVVLLDEFEKAAPETWDVFLSVFDAGRLTDQSGRTVDFRQTIVIVTSNLGSAINAGRGLGFGGSEQGGFSEDGVLRAVRRALRPELVNRFDRLVVFRPLPRDVMRSIVHHEIEDVLRRRGIAHRDWAIEVDEGAVDFLLERGFTVDLGARPLRRAVERYLLAPLAEAIVTHEAPRGAQFLFVTAGERELRVQFVATDDAPPSEPPPALPEEDAAPDAPARTPAPIARDPVGTRAELRILRDCLAVLRDQVRLAEWDERKTALLMQTAERDFWERPGRFGVLAEAETMDRIEARLRGASSLLDRLFSLARDDTARIHREPVARLARELIQLDHSIAALAQHGAQDALVLVEADEGGESLARDLVGMYEAWSHAAGATFRMLHHGADGYRRVFLLDGLGAHRALAGEAGIHVLERSSGRGARRVGTVHVVVEPWSGAPDDDPAEFAAHLERADEERIVRRYQREPTPLVRDAIRRYRTGRLDRVLAGGFDLF